ncbi:hypothetical protein BC831DRAFT_22954 [Entophlyctis helioformis]|nr:hypothetical protein BC831DRAFT_22954 [Entophlyctis helioformis]
MAGCCHRRAALCSGTWRTLQCPEVCACVRGFDAVSVLRQHLRKLPDALHVRDIVAVANVARLSEQLRCDLQDAGVSLLDCASPKPSAADISLVVELMKFVHRHPPPASLCLVSSDNDFAKVLQFLGRNDYNVVLVHGNLASRSLRSAASTAISWELLAIQMQKLGKQHTHSSNLPSTLPSRHRRPQL